MVDSSPPLAEETFISFEGIFMKRFVPMFTFALLLSGALTAQQQIPTGGPIPDRRGFNNSVNDRKLTDPVEEVVDRKSTRLNSSH